MVCHRVVLLDSFDSRALSFCKEIMERVVNRNPALFGPGPLARRPAGIGARPPLQGLVICAAQGLAVALAGGFVYKVSMGDPGIKAIDDYYKENPPK